MQWDKRMILLGGFKWVRLAVTLIYDNNMAKQRKVFTYLLLYFEHFFIVNITG